jgi:5-methylcytosine-specific restriction endonuclease McrA/predicted transcriptional regulator
MMASVEGGMAFKLTRLRQYSDEDLIAELRRVAKLVPSGPLTKQAFRSLSKAGSSTVARRFGTWRNALARAGLEHRYSGRVVSAKMKRQLAREMSDEEMLIELRRVAQMQPTSLLTQRRFDAHAEISSRAVANRFGSWRAALDSAGLDPATAGRRYSDEEYFENLLRAWTRRGRQPTYAEMSEQPSTIGASSYANRWGTWSLALQAFVDYITTARKPTHGAVAETRQESPRASRPSSASRSRRTKIPLGLRYDVLRRDCFKCVACGASPAIDPSCRLHVDHIVPVTAGGDTVVENLQTLCAKCNIGKGAKH